MLGYARIFKDRVYAEGRAEGRAEGKAEGRAEGEAKGRAEGKAEHHRKVSEWNRRRIQAEKEGKEFTEPLPEPESQDNIKSSEK